MAVQIRAGPNRSLLIAATSLLFLWIPILYPGTCASLANCCSLAISLVSFESSYLVLITVQTSEA